MTGAAIFFCRIIILRVVGVAAGLDRFWYFFLQNRNKKRKMSASNLPEDILLDIFSYLDRQQRVEDRSADVKQKNDLGLVCRHWRQAACHDRLWKRQALRLEAQTYKVENPLGGPWIANPERLPLTSHRQPPNRKYHEHYVKLARREVLLKEERKRQFIANVLERCEYFTALPSYIASLTIPYFMLWAQVILAIVHWCLDLGDHTWIYFLSPLLFIIIYLCIALPVCIIWFLTLHTHSNMLSRRLMKFLCITTAFTWFECTPLVLIFLNLGVLPRFHTRLYHVELIPWPAVFAPWTITLFLLSLSCLIISVLPIIIDADIEEIREELVWIDGALTVVTYCAFAFLTGGLSIVLLGFALEFSAHFPMSLTFVPILLLATVTSIKLLLFDSRTDEEWSVEERFFMRLMKWSLTFFHFILLVSVIPCCFAQFIGPCSFLGPMAVVTVLYLVTTGSIVFVTEEYTYCICASRSKYSWREVLCCEGA